MFLSALLANSLCPVQPSSPPLRRSVAFATASPPCLYMAYRWQAILEESGEKDHAI